MGNNETDPFGLPPVPSESAAQDEATVTIAKALAAMRAGATEVDLGGGVIARLDSTVQFDESEGPITVREWLQSEADDQAVIDAMKVAAAFVRSDDAPAQGAQ